MAETYLDMIGLYQAQWRPMYERIKARERQERDMANMPAHIREARQHALNSAEEKRRRKAEKRKGDGKT